MLVGAVLTVLSYSSLAVVLLIATLAASGVIPLTVALGLVLGANLGSGVLAHARHRRRRAAGAAGAARQPDLQADRRAARRSPLLPQVHVLLQQLVPRRAPAGGAASTSASTSRSRCSSSASPSWSAARVDRWLPTRSRAPATCAPRHLDPSALDTPSLAICERRARGAAPGRRRRDDAARHADGAPQQRPARSPSELRKLDDTVDELYSAIKFYLTQISREALTKQESRRWTDIVSFTINMEQIGDIIERVLQDIEDKKIKKNRSFSDAGMAEICDLHERLLANLRLAMSVFLDGDVRDAAAARGEGALPRPRARVRRHPHRAAARQHAQSIETCSLHLDLISDLKRINSHICSIAYPILESAGALTATRHPPVAARGADAGDEERAPARDCDATPC